MSSAVFTVIDRAATTCEKQGCYRLYALVVRPSSMSCGCSITYFELILTSVILGDVVAKGRLAVDIYGGGTDQRYRTCGQSMSSLRAAFGPFQ